MKQRKCPECGKPLVRSGTRNTYYCNFCKDHIDKEALNAYEEQKAFNLIRPGSY